MRTLLTIFFGVALSCQASTVFTVTINSPVSGLPGDVITVQGSLLNNDSVNTQYINSDSFVVAPGFTLDDSPFLSNAPLFLGPGGSTALFDFFTLTISPSQSPGLYSGTFTVVGGADGGAGTAEDNLGTGAFTVNVLGTPEPSTVGMLLGGAALLIARRRRR